MSKSNRTLCILIILSFMVLAFKLFTINQPKELSFTEIGIKSGSDKFTTHQYQYAYEKYLPSLRYKPLKMLEIGLGCNMNYGPGKSLKLWTDYFSHPQAKIHFIEYDENCADKWRDKYPKVATFGGDQSNVKHLESFIEKYGNDFDLIIDDGGHTMDQQQTSFQYLFPIVKPGGLYVIEDLQTSYSSFYNVDNPITTIEMIKKMIDSFYGQGEVLPSWHIDQVRSIDCFHEICVFNKKN